MKLPYRKSKNGVTIAVKVEPRSSKAEITGVLGNLIKIKLTAPPVSGAANLQLVQLLADYFNVRKSDISILKGHSGKNKTVEIRGIESL